MSAETTPAAEPVLPPNVTPMPGSTPPPLPAGEKADPLSQLLKNPLVIAGGAVLAGLVVTRVFGALPVRKLAMEVADEVMRRRRAAGSIPADPIPPTSSGGAPPPPVSGPAADFIQQGWEQMKPQVAGFAQKMLAQLAGKKQ